MFPSNTSKFILSAETGNRLVVALDDSITPKSGKKIMALPQ